MAGQMVCSQCGTMGGGKVRGSWALELILWLCFLVPGIMYTQWRSSGPRACRACGNTTLVPANSPVGQQMLLQHGNVPQQGGVPPTATSTNVSTAERPRRSRLKTALLVLGVIAVLGFVSEECQKAQQAAADHRDDTSSPVSPDGTPNL